MSAPKRKPKKKPLPMPGGYEGSGRERCPHCSFQPTSRADYCDTHWRMLHRKPAPTPKENQP